MNKITHSISQWLAMHNIERKGARIVLELPSESDAVRAEMAIQREIEPMMLHRTGNNFGKIETMNGLGLVLRAPPRS